MACKKYSKLMNDHFIGHYRDIDKIVNEYRVYKASIMINEAFILNNVASSNGSKPYTETKLTLERGKINNKLRKSKQKQS